MTVFTGVQAAEDADEFLEIFERSGFLAKDARELSPRPMPSSMRPWEARLSVAKRLAETVTSRTAGLVTQVRGRIFLGVGGMRVRRGNGSFQMTWESKSAEGEAGDSAWRVRLRILSMESQV